MTTHDIFNIPIRSNDRTQACICVNQRTHFICTKRNINWQSLTRICSRRRRRRRRRLCWNRSFKMRHANIIAPLHTIYTHFISNTILIFLWHSNSYTISDSSETNIKHVFRRCCVDEESALLLCTCTWSYVCITFSKIAICLLFPFMAMSRTHIGRSFRSRYFFFAIQFLLVTLNIIFKFAAA